jgi:ABC-type nitrate/sulfonate/bicarbonate transport system ATPase subunit
MTRNLTTPMSQHNTVPAPKGSIVSVDSIAFSYDSANLAIGDVTLPVPKGEITAIIGPSGCGKSTLLAILAGLKDPAAGSITWDPEVLSAVRATGGRLLTLVFQKDTVLPWLTVEQNVGFGLRYLKQLSSAEKASRVSRLLEMVNLSDVRKRYPYQLSGGMRRRVAFLAGVAPQPSVLLLDEPFSSLDEPSRVGIHADVLRISKEFGMTIVIVTHDLGEAISLADSVVLLSRAPSSVMSATPIPFGPDRDVFTLRQSGTYQELYASLWRDLAAQSWAGRSNDGGASA